MAVLFASVSLVTLSACGGGGGKPQDEDEKAGDYPVEVTTSTFPNRQRLAKTTELKLGVKNTGDKTIPDLAVTIRVEDPEGKGQGATGTGGGGQGSFSTYDKQPDLADPSRPVWVLENGYPRLAGSDEPAGANVAQTDTFAFGQVKPGETREAIWRVTPVRGGTYTVNYRIDASVHGKATAMAEGTNDPVTGKFVVTISTDPPKARVNDRGEVETEEPGGDERPTEGGRSPGGGLEDAP